MINIMASGVNIKYIIAEFNPCAGPSPNCEAVLVQIEHWAERLLLKTKSSNNHKKQPKNFLNILQRNEIMNLYK